MIFDEILTSLQLSFNLFEFLNCYIYYSVEADGDTNQQIHLLNLEKTNSIKMPAFSINNLLVMLILLLRLAVVSQSR